VKTQLQLNKYYYLPRVGDYLPIDIASRPKRLESSATPLLEMKPRMEPNALFLALTINVIILPTSLYFVVLYFTYVKAFFT
jgi:hypothetical protein